MTKNGEKERLINYKPYKTIYMDYIELGGRKVPVKNKNGVPTIKCESEEIRHPDGRVDVIVKVPWLNLQSKTEEI